MQRTFEQRTFEQRVVVGYDDSDSSRDALRWAARIASTRRWGLTLMHVSTPTGEDADREVAPGVATRERPRPEPVAELPTPQRRELKAAMTKLRSFVGDVDVVTVAAESGWVALAEAAQTARLVVVGSRRRHHVDRIDHDSTVERVAATARCPVVVVPGYQHSWRRLPVHLATDLSRDAVEAGRFAIDVADALEVPLHVVTACAGDADQVVRTVDRLRSWTEALQAQRPDVPVRIRVLLGDPVTRLLDTAGDASLTVVGSRGLGYIRGTITGSVGRRIARKSQRPTAVVHRAAGAPA